MGSLEYLVKTTMGNTCLSADSSVYIYTNPHAYVTKKVSDIKSGDLVLFSKPFATTSLADVEPFLTRSPRYDYAHEIIHEKSSKGSYVPKLRFLLATGLANKGIITNKDLESKIFREEGQDFSNLEYRSMEEAVAEIFTEEESPVIGVSGIRKWLSGETLAPRDWSLLEKLAKSVNYSFSTFKEGNEEPNSMYFNYRLYITIRQGVMRFLNNAKGIPGEEGQTSERENKISLTPEFQIVFNHFLKDIDKDNALARVTGIEIPQSLSQLKRDNPSLKQGIVQYSKRLNYPTKRPREVFDELVLLQDYMDSMISNFPYNEKNILKRLLGPSKDQIRAMAHLALPYLLEYFKEPLDPHIKATREASKVGTFSLSHSTNIPPCEEYCEKIKDAFLNREMDKYYNLPIGTSMLMLESIFRLRNATPNRVFSLMVSLGELQTEYFRTAHNFDVQGESGLDKKVKLEREIIKRDYGIRIGHTGQFQNGKRLFTNLNLIEEASERKIEPLNFLETIHMDKIKLKIITEYVIKKANQPDIEFLPKELRNLPEIKELREPKRIEIYKKAEVTNILEQYGLGAIVDLRKPDFYYEEVLN